MCLSIPAKILSLAAGSSKAKVEWEGRKTTVDVSLLPGILGEGDYILVHESTNMAIQKLDTKDAEEIFELVDKCGHRHNVAKK